MQVATGGSVGSEELLIRVLALPVPGAGEAGPNIFAAVDGGGDVASIYHV